MDGTRQQRNLLSLLLVQLALLPSIVAGMEIEPQLSELQSLDCVINPSVVADLGSRIPGVLKTVHVDRSDFVHSGQLIAELESGVDMASLELARKRASLTAEIELRQINAAYGQRQHERIEDLYTRNVISTNDMDQTQTETKLTQIQLRQAIDNQQLAQLELVRAQEIVERHAIRSPVTGVVMERFKTIGEYVDDQPIVRVAQLSPLHVEVIIPVEQLGKVYIGMLADVWSDAIGEKWQAEVSRIDRVADVASGTYGVRLTLENPDYKIPAGLRCRIKFLPTENVTETKITPVSESATPISTIPMEKQIPMNSAADTSTPAAQEVIDISLSENSQCGRLGPFPDKASAQAKASMLQIDGVDIKIQKRTEDVQAGISVMSPPFASIEEVNGYLKSLRASGDKDHFLVGSKGNQPYQVSLGIYSVSQNAERRVKYLQSKGFSVKTQLKYTQQESHWLFVNGQFSLLDFETLQQLADATLDTEIITCTCRRPLNNNI